MVKKIKLSQDKITLVDDEDYEWLSQYNWHLYTRKKSETIYANTNIYINNKRTTKKLHNLLINPSKGFEVDHIDRDGLNNQKENLRIVTRSQNCINRSKFRNTTSKFKGVTWHKDNKKWLAQIRLNKKKYYLGEFINEIDAAKAYNKAAKKLHNRYAVLNEGLK